MEKSANSCLLSWGMVLRIWWWLGWVTVSWRVHNLGIWPTIQVNSAWPSLRG